MFQFLHMDQKKIKKKNIPIIRSTRPLIVNKKEISKEKKEISKEKKEISKNKKKEISKDKKKEISKEKENKNKVFHSIEKKTSKLTTNLSHYHNNSFKKKHIKSNSITNRTNNSHFNENNSNSNLRNSINVVRKVKIPKSLNKKEIQVNTLSMSNKEIM